jgi:GT2 family glycosyltransferase
MPKHIKNTEKLPLVSVVVPTHNRKEKVIRLIKSLLGSDYPMNKLEIIVVDDASTDGTHETIQKKFPMRTVRVIRCLENKLTSEVRNIGFRDSKGEYIFFVDDDVIVNSDSISKLLKFMQENKEVGLAGPIIYYADKPNTIWCAGLKINFWTTLGPLIGKDEVDIGQFQDPIICDGTVTAFMVPRSIASKVSFDSELFPIQFEEIDYCIKIKRNKHEVVVVPWVKIWHDRPLATFLRNPLRTYYTVRNRLIINKLWSKNHAQYIVSRTCSLFISLTYIIISILFTRNYSKTLKAIFTGLRDGIKLSKNMKRYNE